MQLIVGALLLLGCSAGNINSHIGVKEDHIVPVPMYQYANDCGKKSMLHIKPQAKSLLQQDNVPGAGIDKFAPFETVLKDGFLAVDCVKDYMYYRGDKFGDNKHDYKLGPVSNVSIVHYDAFVAKEDKQEMTQKVCFEFCRTVPNMGFFGIVNGRGCYCTPYFTAMESDSSQCDAVGEGENTMLCGGKSKSSIFAMHMCDSTADDLEGRSGAASALSGQMNIQVKTADGLAKGMQAFGAELQDVFGNVGDSGASNLAQDAKVFAGVVEHTAEDAKAAATELGDLAGKGTALKGSAFTDPEVVTKAERIMEGIDEATAAGELAMDQLIKVTDLANPSVKGAKAADQYYPVMYFVDKEFVDVPSTCSGPSVAKPIGGLDKDGCAAACDSHIHECVGFQYFKEGEEQLCFLFSGFKTGFYYTGCGKSSGPTKELKFLQTAQAPFEAECLAKLSKFEGTTLKPDGSGKCEQCFKDLTKADRCY